ncbi:Histidine kinase [Nonlabens sp. Hel1_33_55]|uniref:histidine kinase n=1 Tax=Nonlabens sp. Hel1_33_55 TaxID=1336802 RepID=UPI000875D8ED|nr:sensor histidine kinase [Nonlabens sp. Hel1_33_55]SCY00039.1 Histidine kinase [Nonlabens sp. Hel1_33_55]
MKITVTILSFLCFISCTRDEGHLTQNLFSTSETVYKIGDNPDWQKKDFNDSKWANSWSEPVDNKIFYARKKIILNESSSSFEPFEMIIGAFGDYEVYWDGILIGTNGKPGAEKGEKSDSSTLKKFIIPNSLASKGNHLLAFRFSQFFENDLQRDVVVEVIEYQNNLNERLLLVLFINILAGCFLITGIYFSILFLNNQSNKENLLFGLSSILFFILIIFEYSKFYTAIHYTNFYTRLRIIGLLNILIAFLIPYYFSVQFRLKNKNVLALSYLSILVVTAIIYYNQYDKINLRLGQLMWLSSIVIIIYAISKKRQGSYLMLAGLIVSFVVYQISIYDISLFVSFTIVLLLMYYILSIRAKEQRIAYENSLIESSRLKLELLKKSIQPHFLLNTLTSLIDWIEESPKKGVMFIEALAEEFNILNEVENQALIPIQKEINLCKSLIDIMRFRKEVNYIWSDEGVDKNFSQKIPPGVIHTLLENSITHCKPNSNNEMRFYLKIYSDKEKTVYNFSTMAQIREPKNINFEGTGHKYVKARLKESYKDSWLFTSKENKDGWMDKIIINP